MDPLTSPPSLIDQVYQRLVDAIADGSLAPNERITQGELAHRLAVSRQPISHALQLLKRQGLVVEEGRRGLVVAPVRAEQILNLYQVRAALDGLASRLAAARVRKGDADPQEVGALKACFTAGRSLRDSASVHEWIEADVAFHSAIHILSGNSAIGETAADRWPHFKRGMGMALVKRERQKSVWVEHGDIYRRIMAGDPIGAEKAAIGHLQKAGAQLYAELSAQTNGA
ncbi:MAG TPA: GntR family transcriptional regulator [Bauldia sp.]|nr:GntR family transcriptional regulator [Bauldia sp.]